MTLVKVTTLLIDAESALGFSFGVRAQTEIWSYQIECNLTSRDFLGDMFVCHNGIIQLTSAVIIV